MAGKAPRSVVGRLLIASRQRRRALTLREHDRMLLALLKPASARRGDSGDPGDGLPGRAHQADSPRATGQTAIPRPPGQITPPRPPQPHSPAQPSPKPVAIVQCTELDDFNRQANAAQPNTVYEFGQYRWATDELGRVDHVQGKVDLTKHGRKTTDHLTTAAIGKSADAKAGDVGFHLVGDQLNGPINLLNVVPGNGVSLGDLKSLNLSAYKAWENNVVRLAKAHPDVTIKIKAVYSKHNKTTRPDVIEALYKVGDGRWEHTLFRNKAGG